MKKIVIIVAVATIPLITIIGGLYFFGTMKKQNYVQEAIDSIEDVYYQELAIGCSKKDKSEYRCCLASVYDMSESQAKLSDDTVCKDMAINQLKCLGSHKWCVPMADVTMPIGAELDNDNDHQACEVDADCVPATCCHATDVINKEFAPDCEGVMCTMSCETVLDCGQGQPVCNDGICTVEIK